MDGPSLSEIFVKIHRAVKEEAELEGLQAHIDGSVDLREKVDSLKVLIIINNNF